MDTMYIPKQITFYVLHYLKLETLIQDHYRGYYDSCARNSWSNKEDHTYGISGTLFSTEQEEFDYYKNFPDDWDRHISADIMLNALARDGHIPYGHYLVKIDW